MILDAAAAGAVSYEAQPGALITPLAADVAREKGIQTYMCGEMAGEPLYAPILLGLGVDELSMNPQAIPLVKNAIRSINTADLSDFMDAVMRKTQTRCTYVNKVVLCHKDR